MRTIIDLSDEQITALTRHCEKHTLSRAAAIREAVNEYLCRHEDDSDDQAFGILKSQAVDGLTLQNQLRDEWR